MMGTGKPLCCYNRNQVGHISRGGVCPDNKIRRPQTCSCCGKGGHVKESCGYKKVKCYK